MHQDMRRQNQTHLSDTKSTVTRHSGLLGDRDVIADVGRLSDPEAGDRGDVVVEPASDEGET